MKTYFKWCEDCQRATEHDKIFAYLKQEYMLICLKCCPDAKVREEKEFKMLFMPRIPNV